VHVPSSSGAPARLSTMCMSLAGMRVTHKLPRMRVTDKPSLTAMWLPSVAAHARVGGSESGMVVQVRFGCGHRVLCEGCLRHLLARCSPRPRPSRRTPLAPERWS
jgi:hypothetical protein